MKVKSIIAGLSLILISAIGTANAQEKGELAVKILPTTQKGVLKILYAYDAGHSVDVKFYNEDGDVFSDRVKAKSFENGFLKNYDVRQLEAGFWVEISSPSISVTYRILESKDRSTLVPFLEKTTYNHLLVAANN